MNNTALLIIDVQVNMFAEGSSVFEGERILNTISRLIAKAHTAHLQVIYIQNNGSEVDPDMPGTPGWQIHPAVTPKKGDIVIQKHTPDSFHETNLQSELDAKQIHNLIIAGMQTDYCINSTCRRAFELGYEVTLVQDAHSTYDNREFTASQLITRYNNELREMVNLKEAKDIAFG
jgi:nicotinamidase-related amidase